MVVGDGERGRLAWRFMGLCLAFCERKLGFYSSAHLTITLLDAGRQGVPGLEARLTREPDEVGRFCACISNSIDEADPGSEVRNKFGSSSTLERWDDIWGVGTWLGM